MTRSDHLGFACAAICAGIIACSAASAQPTRLPDAKAVVPLSAETLYQGWRASSVLGKEVVSRSDQKLGTVRNLLVGRDGGLEAMVVEGGGVTDLRPFMFRIPWQKVQAAKLPDRIVVDVANGARPEYGIFGGQPGVPESPNEFPVTHIIGDYARLQAGQGYGYASDVVFDRQGEILAVLITRDAAGGGGTRAFGFPSSPAPQWDPGASYYGLPYVTAQQADAAGVPVDAKRFTGGDAG
jgi:sporulation protein YlmC with PRC-barrel domain